VKIQKQYHYFISGLPDLSFDDKKEWTSVTSFKKILEDQLHPDDYEQVKLVFLKDDHYNLINFLETGEIDEGRPGNFTLDHFRDQVSLFSAILPSEDILPPYMVKILQENIGDEAGINTVQISHMLAEGYYRYIIEKGSPFLKAFNEFDYNLNNLIAFMKTGEYLLDQKQFITGDSGHAMHLRSFAGKNLMKDHEFEYFEEILSYTESLSFAEEELKYDKLRWKVIEEMIFFEDFTLDWILGYLEQMIMISRWSSLKRESGEAKLRKMMHESWQETLKSKEIESDSV